MRSRNIAGVTLARTASYSIRGNAHNRQRPRVAWLALSFLAIASSAVAQIPSNDSFSSAITVSGVTGSISGTNVNATKQAGEPTHWDPSAGRSVWYFWTAPSTEAYAFFTENSSADPVVAVYTGGAVNALALIVNDDDGGPGLECRAQFNAIAGTTYRIAMDGWSTSSGSFTLRWGRALSGPVITSPLTAAGTIGQQFVYQLEATGATARSASNLPPGLSYNSGLNAIVGTPTQVGNFSVALTASNQGGTTQATLALSILPVPTGPRITSSSSATGRTGVPFTFQVITSGGSSSTRLNASGLPSGLSFDAMTGRISGTPSSNGSTAVTLTVTGGGFSNSSILQLTFTSDPAIPVIVSSNEARVASGQAFNYQINAPVSGANAPSFTLLGNLPPGLGFNSQNGTIFGTFTPSVQVRQGAKELSGGVVTNVQLFATNSSGTTSIPLVFILTPTGVANISTRLAIGTGDNVLIGGFIITGNAPKKVIIRAIGPSLSSAGVPVGGRISDPVLELRAGETLLAANDDWRNSQEQEIIDSTVAPPDNREAAIVAVLNPGAYTAAVKGFADETGIGSVEVYDLGTASLESSSSAKLANLSTRGVVQTGNNVMIGGFIITGGTTRVIVRAIGPELTGRGVPGALQDTTLELNGPGGVIASNDDWRSTQQQLIIDSTVPPLDDREAAIVASLPPGGYTAIVRGKNGTVGVGLVEVFVLP